MDHKKLPSMVIAAIMWVFLTGESPLDGWPNCKERHGPTQDAVCKHGSLLKLYRQVKDNIDLIKLGFVDSDMEQSIEQDFSSWLEWCDVCDGEVECLKNEFRKKLAILRGDHPDLPFTGAFIESDFGGIGIYPLGDRYLVGIQTAENSQIRWMCDAKGYGIRDGNKLLVAGREGEYKISIPIVLHDHQTLIIKETPKLRIVHEIICGWNGYIYGTYKRITVEEHKRRYR
ncbi:MAG: hypothetical protein HQL64_15985 [Magnetococcales bacterium]|nr:hypothetical protein [Magnetococcales bacterium]